MIHDDTTSLNTKKNKIKNNKMEDCNVSKASNEIMLDRISVDDKQEFPFINFSQIDKKI